jgi:hypothetical protein
MIFEEYKKKNNERTPMPNSNQCPGNFWGKRRKGTVLEVKLLSVNLHALILLEDLNFTSTPSPMCL